MKVLLVDDEVGVLHALERLFRRRGHEVRAAIKEKIARGTTLAACLSSWATGRSSSSR